MISNSKRRLGCCLFAGAIMIAGLDLAQARVQVRKLSSRAANKTPKTPETPSFRFWPKTATEQVGLAKQISGVLETLPKSMMFDEALSAIRRQLPGLEVDTLLRLAKQDPNLWKALMRVGLDLEPRHAAAIAAAEAAARGLVLDAAQAQKLGRDVGLQDFGVQAVTGAIIALAERYRKQVLGGLETPASFSIREGLAAWPTLRKRLPDVFPEKPLGPADLASAMFRSTLRPDLMREGFHATFRKSELQAFAQQEYPGLGASAAREQMLRDYPELEDQLRWWEPEPEHPARQPPPPEFAFDEGKDLLRYLRQEMLDRADLSLDQIATWLQHAPHAEGHAWTAPQLSAMVAGGTLPGEPERRAALARGVAQIVTLQPPGTPWPEILRLVRLAYPHTTASQVRQLAQDFLLVRKAIGERLGEGAVAALARAGDPVSVPVLFDVLPRIDIAGARDLKMSAKLWEYLQNPMVIDHSKHVRLWVGRQMAAFRVVEMTLGSGNGMLSPRRVDEQDDPATQWIMRQVYGQMRDRPTTVPMADLRGYLGKALSRLLKLKPAALSPALEPLYLGAVRAAMSQIADEYRQRVIKGAEAPAAFWQSLGPGAARVRKLVPALFPEVPRRRRGIASEAALTEKDIAHLSVVWNHAAEDRQQRKFALAHHLSPRLLAQWFKERPKQFPAPSRLRLAESRADVLGSRAKLYFSADPLMTREDLFDQMSRDEGLIYFLHGVENRIVLPEEWRNWYGPLQKKFPKRFPTLLDASQREALIREEIREIFWEHSSYGRTEVIRAFLMRHLYCRASVLLKELERLPSIAPPPVEPGRRRGPEAPPGLFEAYASGNASLKAPLRDLLQSYLQEIKRGKEDPERILRRAEGPVRAALISASERARISYDLPLLTQRVEKLGSRKPLRGRNLLWVTHLLGPKVALVRALKAAGISPENGIVVGTPYGSNRTVRAVFEEEGFDTRVPELSVEDYRRVVRQAVDDAIGKYIENGRPILAMDDGGLISEILSDPWYAPYRGAFRIVEQTTRGVAVAQQAALGIPTVAVATSKSKKQEAEYIARAVVAKLERRLREEVGLGLEGLHVAIMGHGNLGTPVAEQLAQRGVHATVVETSGARAAEARAWTFSPDGARVIRFHVAAEDEALPTADLVLGVTGEGALGEATLRKLKPGAVVAHAASKQEEIDMGAAKRLGIRVLNGGWPVNFDGDVNDVPPDEIVITELAMFEGALQAASLDPREKKNQRTLPLRNDKEVLDGFKAWRFWRRQQGGGETPIDDPENWPHEIRRLADRFLKDNREARGEGKL